MNERTKTGFEILQVAVIIGALGDMLLRSTPWGLNVFLFNLAFAAGMITILYRRAPQYLTRHTLSLFAALMFFASMFVWRDSIELRTADAFAIIAILSVIFVPTMKVPPQLAGIFQYGVAFVWSAFNAVFAPFALLLTDIEWKNSDRSGWSRNLIAAIRGIAIVTPILLIFGGLFIAADAAYQGWAQRIFSIQPEIVFTHILLITAFTWMSAGYLRGVLINESISGPAMTQDDASQPQPDPGHVEQTDSDVGLDHGTIFGNISILEHINISDPPDPPQDMAVDEKSVDDEKPADPVDKEEKFDWGSYDNTIIPPVFTLGTVEVGVIFGLVNLLFLSFVIVQVPYLFGGMDLVQNTPDFKLAEYARRGFGELVTVSALVLPLLLASHWLVRKDDPLTEKLFRALAVVQIALLFVIMASAVQRLVLLTGNLGYGLTTIRLYPMIFMTWLAIVSVWFGFTVLRGSRKYFAWGALWSAILILGATHVLNPDEFIVKTNIALMQQGRDFDASYNSNLSDDAIPALTNSFAELNDADQQTVIRSMFRRFCQDQAETDLRSWNYGRWKASRFVGRNGMFADPSYDCSSLSFADPYNTEYR